MRALTPWEKWYSGFYHCILSACNNIWCAVAIWSNSLVTHEQIWSLQAVHTAESYSGCLPWTRPWVWSPVPKENIFSPVNFAHWDVSKTLLTNTVHGFHMQFLVANFEKAYCWNTAKHKINEVQSEVDIVWNVALDVSSWAKEDSVNISIDFKE
jgi:hypothetical protein